MFYLWLWAVILVALWGGSGALMTYSARYAVSGDDAYWFWAGLFCVPFWALGVFAWRAVGELGHLLG